MRTERGFERLITFAAAVVAIALTLLVLPLVEIPGELRGDQGIGAVLSRHGDQLGAFVVSFVVIWALWSVHNRTMEYFDPYDAAVMRLTMLSLLGLSWWGRRHRQLLLADRPEVDEWVNEPVSVVIVAILALALVLSIVFPGVGTWPLLALLFDDTIERLVLRLRRKPLPRRQRRRQG